MKTTIQEIYKCDHCNKLYQVESACKRHEESCKRNPSYMRPCHTCNIIEKVDETIWDRHGSRSISVLFCKKRDCFIYPPSVAAKGNAFDMGEKSNIEMPNECELYVKNFY